MKKLLAVLLTMAMAVTLLAGCGGGPKTASKADKSSGAEDSNTLVIYCPNLFYFYRTTIFHDPRLF